MIQVIRGVTNKFTRPKTLVDVLVTDEINVRDIIVWPPNENKKGELAMHQLYVSNTYAMRQGWKAVIMILR